jgi:hypothetical protein
MQLTGQLSRPRLVKLLGLFCSFSALLQTASLLAQPTIDSAGAALIQSLDKSSTWTLLAATPLGFNTFHPQGMVKVNDHFFLSSVETIESPAPISDSKATYDRTPGIGQGHLFKFTANGQLVDHIILGEGAQYHPGGIDFDGQSLWVSVAQYRPDSKSIVYRVDPDTMTSTEVLRFDDHLGAIVRDTDTGSLHGVSWGSRKLYSWQQHAAGDGFSEATMTLNPSHYIDYQDCQYVLISKMLCSGLSSYRGGSGTVFKLGGIDLIDLISMGPIFQLPVTITTASGALLTQNPFFAELTGSGPLIFYFLPDDNHSVLYQYSVR